MVGRKVIYIICLVGILLLNIFYVDFQFMMMLIVVAVVPLISWIIFTLSKLDLRIILVSPSAMVEINKPNEISVKTTNSLPFFLTNGSVKVIEKYSECDERLRKTVHVEAFLDTVETKLELIPVHCGIMNIEIERFDIYDYLMLFHSKRKYQGNKSFVVLPQILSLGDDDGNRRNPEESDVDSQSLVVGQGEDIIDLREFKAGDSQKHIHWKLSANNPKDEYIVKKFAETDDRIKAILVDLTFYDKDDFRDNLDRIYQMAYSIGYYYALNNERVALIAYNDRYSNLEMYEFNDNEGLITAISNVMKIKCSKNADNNLCRIFLNMGLLIDDKPIFVTARGLSSNKFKVVNVLEDSIGSVL